MNIEVAELRKGDRFTAVEPIPGTFGPSECVIVDLSLAGAKISHPHPLRIGTRARLWFKRGDITASVQAHVVWSHLGRTPSGMVYRSGLRLEAADPQYALAINTFVRAGILRKDAESMDRKRERVAEREAQRKAQVRTIPTGGGMVE
jgi:hypothetical protein